MSSLFYDIVASSPDSKSKTENFTGATSSEHDQKSPFDEKGQVSESQRSQVSPSASQQPSTPTLNGLISSKSVCVYDLVGWPLELSVCGFSDRMSIAFHFIIR